MEDYKMTVGLEIHAELKTKSKMFCGCKNSPNEGSPNTHTCPICLGYPGTLPVINKEAVKKVLLVGAAVNGEVADFTEFDRKNYFYPDIPKGYQISQYKYPLVKGGELSLIKLTRIHLEEDTAKSSHETPGVSLIDFNRAGVPLMELVTEAVIHSSDEALNFAKELQLLLQYLDVSDANMEKGEMRVEVNISVSKNEKLGTKVEVKNINSFKAAAKSIDFEFERHKALLLKGENVVQETRGWDENKEITFSQRSKENAHDYRYFPEPDLPKLILSELPEFNLETLKRSLPELPFQKRQRLISKGIKPSDVEVYINNKNANSFFEEVMPTIKEGEYQLASNYITSVMIGISKTEGKEFSKGNVEPREFGKMIGLIDQGVISSTSAKVILETMYKIGGEAELIAKEKGLVQNSDPEEIKKVAQKITDSNPNVVAEYKSGKTALLQFFVGQGMKESKGSINPEILKKVLLEILG